MGLTISFSLFFRLRSPPNVVSALPITFMFRKGIEACWVLTRKIERKKNCNGNGSRRDTITFMFRKGIEACWVLSRKIEGTKKYKKLETETDVEVIPITFTFRKRILTRKIERKTRKRQKNRNGRDTLCFRKAIEACWVLMRKIEK